MEQLIQMHKLGYFYNRASCKWLRVFKIHFWGFNTWRLKISPLLHGLWCERRTTLSVLLDHWQEWVHTFHLPCDSTVMHFKGSVADFLVVLVQASAWFVKCGVSCLLCCWNQRGNTESICLWRKGTAVVHRREIRSKNTVSPLLPSRSVPESKRSNSHGFSVVVHFKLNWRCWGGPFWRCGELRCFENKLFPRNLARHCLV